VWREHGKNTSVICLICPTRKKGKMISKTGLCTNSKKVKTFCLPTSGKVTLVKKKMWLAPWLATVAKLCMEDLLPT